MNDPDYWLRYRKADLVAQIAAEEAMGRTTGLLHAAKRMVAHLEEREADMDPKKDYAISIKSYDSTPETVSVAMCDQCLTPHPKAFCPKRITADKENALGKKKKDEKAVDVFWESLRLLRSDVDGLTARMAQRENAHRNLHASLEATDREVYGLRDFVHRANTEANKRLDDLEDKVTILDSSRICEVQRLNNIVLRVEQLEKTVADLTGRMGAREDAAHNLVEALDDVNKNLDTTDECVNVLKDTVATLADCVENLNRAQESTTATLKTQHHLTQRLHKRVSALEDRRDAPRYEMPKDCHCGHMEHPGQRCLYRRELPGETYECPCDDSPPTDESLTDRIAAAISVLTVLRRDVLKTSKHQPNTSQSSSSPAGSSP